MNTPFSIIIVDDEPLARKGLNLLLQDQQDFFVAAECENGRQTLEAIAQHQPDIVLLDIQMPGKDGIDVVKSLQGDASPLVVFVTAYNQYAIEAFEVHAIDYLLKPVDPQRLALTLERCKHYLSEFKPSKQEQLLNALRQIDKASAPDHEPQTSEQILQVRDGKNLYRFKYTSIQWIESAGDYVCIHSNQEKSVIHTSLKQLESQLCSKQFLRVHRSRIVNLCHIHRISPLCNGEHQIELYNGSKLRTGRKYKQVLKDLLDMLNTAQDNIR